MEIIKEINKNELIGINDPNTLHSIGYCCPDGNTNLDRQTHITSFSIPTNITKLGDYCFSSCANLTSITIPDSVEYLGRYCFGSCANLTSITIPDSVKYIDRDCFEHCHNLTSIYVSEDKTYLIVPQLRYLNSYCKIITYKPKPSENKQTLIEPKITISEITEEYQPDLVNFNNYIEERTEILENQYCTNSVIGYHETVIDIADEIYKSTKLKSEELTEYIKLVQDYNTNLIKISSDIAEKIKFHEDKIKELQENNYKVPELNTIKDKLNKIILFEEDDDFNTVVKLNDNYYLVDNNLIIPKTDNPHTEIYKLPCDFNQINPENKKILTKSEKKIALLSIEYQHEYIDLSNTNIQYFINTFKKCENLKEIVYPESKEIIIE